MGGFGREKKHENLPAHVLGLNVGASRQLGSDGPDSNLQSVPFSFASA